VRLPGSNVEWCDACLDNRNPGGVIVAEAVSKLRVPESLHPDGVMWVCGPHEQMIDEGLAEIEFIAPVS